MDHFIDTKIPKLGIFVDKNSQKWSDSFSQSRQKNPCYQILKISDKKSLFNYKWIYDYNVESFCGWFIERRKSVKAVKQWTVSDVGRTGRGLVCLGHQKCGGDHPHPNTLRMVTLVTLIVTVV